MGRIRGRFMAKVGQQVCRRDDGATNERIRHFLPTLFRNPLFCPQTRPTHCFSSHFPEPCSAPIYLGTFAREVQQARLYSRNQKEHMRGVYLLLVIAGCVFEGDPGF